MPASAVERYGVGFMEAIRAQRFAGGGFVQPTGAAFPSSSSSVDLPVDRLADAISERLTVAVANMPRPRIVIGDREFAEIVQDATYRGKELSR
jgi:hypothetical protein